VEFLGEIAPQPVAAIDLVVGADHEGGIGISEDQREQEDHDFDRIFTTHQILLFLVLASHSTEKGTGLSV
jgi:hypothetical protein